MVFRIVMLMMIVAGSGCVNVRTEPIQVEPIHITVDVYVKVDRALEDFFGEIDESSATMAPP